jgi:hypothetical protein
MQVSATPADPPLPGNCPGQQRQVGGAAGALLHSFACYLLLMDPDLGWLLACLPGHAAGTRTNCETLLMPATAAVAGPKSRSIGTSLALACRMSHRYTFVVKKAAAVLLCAPLGSTQQERAAEQLQPRHGKSACQRLWRHASTSHCAENSSSLVRPAQLSAPACQPRTGQHMCVPDRPAHLYCLCLLSCRACTSQSGVKARAGTRGH